MIVVASMWNFMVVYIADKHKSNNLTNKDKSNGKDKNFHEGIIQHCHYLLKVDFVVLPVKKQATYTYIHLLCPILSQGGSTLVVCTHFQPKLHHDITSNVLSDVIFICSLKRTNVTFFWIQICSSYDENVFESCMNWPYKD